jgi:pilus assembly protein CpaE
MDKTNALASSPADSPIADPSVTRPASLRVVTTPGASGATVPSPQRFVRPALASQAFALAFVSDEQSHTTMQRSFADLKVADGTVVRGTIDTAIAELKQRGSPRFLIVDMTGIDDPMKRLRDLAEVCDPATEVVAIGDRNDIVLYRDLKAAGIAEYFFKPLVSGVVSRLLGAVMTGILDQRSPRTGKLVIALGVHGSVGATTIASQVGWYLAEKRDRSVIIVDLDLHGGDAALQFDTTPNHALIEALDHPERVDDLFLDRGVIKVTPRLGLLAALEPLSEATVPAEASVSMVLGELMRRYRYVIVDMPMGVALRLPQIVQSATTILLVGDCSLVSAREVLRWRERIGPNTSDRSTLHVLNKRGADGALPDSELTRALGHPPDTVIDYDRKIARFGVMGARALAESGAMMRALTPLVRELAGAASDRPEPTFWQRVLG